MLCAARGHFPLCVRSGRASVWPQLYIYTCTLIFLFINNLMSSLGLQAAYTAGKLLARPCSPPQCLREKLHRTAYIASLKVTFILSQSARGTAHRHGLFFAAKDASRSVFTHFASSFRWSHTTCSRCQSWSGGDIRKCCVRERRRRPQSSREEVAEALCWWDWIINVCGCAGSWETLN